MRITLLFITVFGFVFSATGQSAFEVSQLSKITPRKNIKTLQLPAFDKTLLKAVDSKSATGPVQYAHPYDVDITVTDSQWKAEEGQYVWEYKVSSKGAYSLNFGFDKFQIPQGVELYFISIKEQKKYGPFVYKDVDKHDQIWSPIIPGEDIIVRLESDSKTLLSDVDVHLHKVNHDYKNFLGVSSGSCNVDVICGEENGFPLIDRYRDQMQSVGVISVDGLFACSGFLVNNTANDKKPYFITAKHCLINQTNSASVVVYWNYENSTCRTPNSIASGRDGDGQLNIFNTGSTLVAESSDIFGTKPDFSLLLLDDPVPDDANPYFAGWSRDLTLRDTSVVIHHPGTEEKRISFDYDAPVYTNEENEDGDLEIAFLRILDYDLGTTEGGSSGSPLFDKNGYVIASVSAGDAACGNDKFDDYAIFAQQWEGSGVSGTRLQDYLDPLGIDPLLWDGIANGYSVIVENQLENICGPSTPQWSTIGEFTDDFSGSVDLEIINKSEEKINVEFEQSTIQNSNSFQLNFDNLDDLETGEYSVLISATDETGNSGNGTYRFRIIQNSPAAPSAMAPLPDTNLEIDRTFLSWNDTGEKYTVEVSQSADFNTLVINKTDLLDTTYNLVDLELAQVYYWRVKSENLCGNSDYSATRRFFTPVGNCYIYSAQDLPITISPNGSPTIESFIDVPDIGEIDDIQVTNLIGDHTYIDDLIFRLISPEGQTIRLAEFLCDSEDGFSFGFDDFGNDPAAISCPPIDVGRIIPQDALQSLKGTTAEGRWTLQIEDFVNEDGGQLQDWNLQICTDLKTDNEDITEELPEVTLYPNPASDALSIEGLSLFGGSTSLEIITAGGQPLPIYNRTVNTDNHTMNISNLPDGLYILRIQGDNETLHRKFLKL